MIGTDAATEQRIENHRRVTNLNPPAGPDLRDPEHFDQARVERMDSDTLYTQVLAAAITPTAFEYARKLGVWMSAIEAEERARKASLTEYEQSVEARLEALRVSAEAKRRFDVERFGEAVVLAPVDLDDLLSWESPDWLVDGLLVESSVAFVAGKSNIGKTFLCLDLALSVAAGIDFLGQDTKPGRVLYLAGEGLPGLRNRVRAWLDHKGVSVSPDAFKIMSAGALLSDPVRVDELVEIVRAGQFSLVVLDTFSQLSGVDNENDAAQVAAVIRSAARLRDANPGTVVLFIHHLNADGSKMRGSTAIQANADTVVKVDVHGDDESAPFSLTTRRGAGGKQKDGEAITIDGLTLRSIGPSAVVVRETGLLGADMSSSEGRAVQAFRTSLDGTREYSTADLIAFCAESVFISQRAAERAISRAVAEGVLEKVSRGSYRPTGALSSLLDGMGSL